MCEAVPWPGEPSADDAQTRYWLGRSFAAASGTMPTRVVVILAAHFAGACPHLQSSMNCDIYGRRPAVCRIYPAEINPFTSLKTSRKLCPPEAWSEAGAVLAVDGGIVAAATRADIVATRAADAADAGVKSSVCAALRLNAAALAKEGLVVYSPPAQALLAALEEASAGSAAASAETQWIIVSPSAATLADLATVGAVGIVHAPLPPPPYQYIGLTRE